MAAKTPRTDEVRTVYMAEARTGPQLETVAENAAAFDRWLDATLAAVRPNPDDEAQVEIAAEVLHDRECGPCREGDPFHDGLIPQWAKSTARAVLTALAAMDGERPCPTPETCYLCAEPLPDAWPERKTSIPLCRAHWNRWMALFDPNADALPPCAAHLILDADR